MASGWGIGHCGNHKTVPAGQSRRNHSHSASCGSGGGSDPDSDDEELTIELGAVAGNQAVCVANDNDGMEDDEDDKVVMALITSELEALVTALDV